MLSPADVLVFTVVLKSAPGDKHLPELGGEGLEVHVIEEEGQLRYIGTQVPVLSNLPRRFTIQREERGRLVVHVSTRADDACGTNYEGTDTPIEWDDDDDDDTTEDVRYIIDAAEKTDRERAEMLDSYG